MVVSFFKEHWVIGQKLSYWYLVAKLADLPHIDFRSSCVLDVSLDHFFLRLDGTSNAPFFIRWPYTLGTSWMKTNLLCNPLSAFANGGMLIRNVLHRRKIRVWSVGLNVILYPSKLNSLTNTWDFQNANLTCRLTWSWAMGLGRWLVPDFRAYQIDEWMGLQYSKCACLNGW